jgi:hypothetical protein
MTYDFHLDARVEYREAAAFYEGRPTFFLVPEPDPRVS